VSADERLARLERELRELRDLEEIRALKARYFAAVDVGWEAELPDKREQLIDGVFAEDVVLEMLTADGFTVLRGREALRDVYEEQLNAYPFGIHYGTNDLVELDGERASAAWHVLAPCTDPQNVSRWFGGRYLVDLVRTPEGWRIARLHQQVAFFTAFSEPWSGTGA